MKKVLFTLGFVALFCAGCTDEQTVVGEVPQADVPATRALAKTYTTSEKDVCFGLSSTYDDGVEPAVAVNAQHVFLEVHRSSVASDKMWYHVGSLEGMSVNWSGSRHYDDGVEPSVALNDRRVAVEVHRAPTKTVSKKLVKKGWLRYYELTSYYKTWYHVGVLSGSRVSWGGSVHYSEGEEPDIALNNAGYCVEVHRSGDKLYVCGGEVNSQRKRVSFGSESCFATDGSDPEVALNNVNQVVAVYRKGSSALYYRAGVLTSNKGVSWGTASYLCKGGKCDVSLTDAGDVLCVYEQNGVLCRVGGNLNASSKKVNWNTSSVFDRGTYTLEKGQLATPSVAMAGDGSIAIQAHSSRNLSFSRILNYSTSLYVDRMNWMSAEQLGSRRMDEICLPGSHDSGTFTINSSSSKIYWSNGTYQKDSELPSSLTAPFAKAQDLDLLDQLKAGARYFDLRPYYKGTGDGIYAHHLLVGASFKDMLDDVRTFMNSTYGEIVLLNLSHFSNFNTHHGELASMLHRYLGDYLYRHTGGSSLGSLTYNGIVNSNRRSSKVVVIYRGGSGMPDGFCRSNGFFNGSQAGIYDKYANVPDYASMRSDQLSKLKSRSGSGELFLLNWTLTPNFDDARTGLKTLASAFLSQDMGGLSNRCNAALGSFTGAYSRYGMNILLTDYLERSRSTDCAILLNRNNP